MGFDIAALSRAIAEHGPVVRVVVAKVEGSSPREIGAAMLVWATGTEGTIGGGALEWQAIANARGMSEGHRITRHPLGPSLGQCCGGAVTLWSEVLAAAPEGPVVARGAGPMPLAVARLVKRARDRGQPVAPQLVQGWMVEPVARPTRQLWIWGAGHVGRALIDTIRPLPDFAITWLDTAADRFPAIPEGVTARWSADVADMVTGAPPQAEHLVLTYSHPLDLEICHSLLQHGFRFAGLIGSATKAARFSSRLAALGHDPARITCPIGDPALGKHPQAIAVGVASQLLRNAAVAAAASPLTSELKKDISWRD
ncbi:xanthine dehydrogenase accessory protein XdhC [Falsirhodobacter sp. alg1]|uniref:xanthine dehydrogenase accessory protein XdhC n=1 Tax=Falsirhodobacter sp. alg1 TaxID=1472418 RepID=UPI0005EEDEAC|nr:xanthine dehydrogenase accessory protein XdhC [Falsirhodobacter sp. alg1]